MSKCCSQEWSSYYFPQHVEVAHGGGCTVFVNTKSVHVQCGDTENVTVGAVTWGRCCTQETFHTGIVGDHFGSGRWHSTRFQRSDTGRDVIHNPMPKPWHGRSIWVVACHYEWSSCSGKSRPRKLRRQILTTFHTKSFGALRGWQNPSVCNVSGGQRKQGRWRKRIISVVRERGVGMHARIGC